MRWSGGSDELDLDATVENLAGNPVPSDDDVVVRERVRVRRSVVLVVDVSGSMRGERVRTAAATVGALGGELARDRLAVVAFWSDAAVLVPLGERVEPMAVLDLLVRVPAQGLTNVSFALEVARRQLVGVPTRDARVLLLSDCVHNAGPDPQVQAVRGFADDVAERIATLGGSPKGTPGSIVAERDWEDYSIGRDTAIAHLGALDVVYQGVISSVRDVIEKTGDLDPVTEDMLTGQSAELELFHWFIRAHLENSGGSLSTGDATSEDTAAAEASS